MHVELTLIEKGVQAFFNGPSVRKQVPARHRLRLSCPRSSLVLLGCVIDPPLFFLQNIYTIAIVSQACREE